MNWRRGIFRLWVVLSVLWVALIFGSAYQRVATITPPSPGFILETEIGHPSIWIKAFSFPVLSGAALMLLLWIIAGFAPRR